MLDEAERKKSRKGNLSITFQHGDCLALPLPDSCADVVTIAFGLRNLQDRHRGLQEMHRILRKPHGTLFVLEFTQPAVWLRPCYLLYLKYGLPLVASLTTGRADAYHYLTESIRSFPDKMTLAAEIQEAGFKQIDILPLTGSLVAMHSARLG